MVDKVENIHLRAVQKKNAAYARVSASGMANCTVPRASYHWFPRPSPPPREHPR